jgi:hypothetical protein
MSETVRQAKTLLGRIVELKTRFGMKHEKLDRVEEALRHFLASKQRPKREN